MPKLKLPRHIVLSFSGASFASIWSDEFFLTFLRLSPSDAPDGMRGLAMAHWDVSGPPQFGGAQITNIRNVKSSHWRG